jgi:hypothetical protein
MSRIVGRPRDRPGPREPIVPAPAAIRAMLLGLAAVAAGVTVGCVHIGPSTIVEDRLAYNEAVATTWKEQTLLNIVKLRYADAPFFMDVAQIVSGYTLARTAGVEGAVVSDPDAVRFSELLAGSLNYQRAFSDRPTISYAPLNNNARFIQNLTLPLPPHGVLYLMQAGYPVDLIFDLTLDSINGVRNRSVIGGQLEPATPEFRRVTQIMRRAQASGHVGMRIEVDKDKRESLVMFFRDPDIETDLVAELAELRHLLRIPPGQKELQVVYGAVASKPNEIAFMTRSAIRVLVNLSTFVEAPASHLASGRAADYGGTTEAEPRFVVHSGCEKPCDCYAAVCYRGCWFWIDDCDLESKRTMAYLMVLLALADAGVKETVPFLTIQAN